MGTPDPADRMAAVREAMAREGAKLRDAMQHTDANGHPTDTPEDDDQ